MVAEIAAERTAGSGQPVSRVTSVGAIAWLMLTTVWMTWTPLHLSPEPNWPTLYPRTNPVDLVGNLLLLAPLGAVIALTTTVRPIRRAVAGAAAFSLAIEAGQILLIGRTASFTDLLLNTVGALLGALVAVRMQRRLGARPLLLLAGGAVFGVLLFFTLWAGAIISRGMRLAGWDPAYPILIGIEGDGEKRYQGDIRDARICAGYSAARVCAGPGAPAAVRKRLAEVAERTQHVDVSARIRSDVDLQWGPARILTFSADSYRRNITLGQEGAMLVLRLRTPLGGSNGRDLEIWIPRAIRAGQPLTLHASYDSGTVRTELISPAETRIVHHRFDALSSGLLLRGFGSVTPRQIVATRLLGGVILVLPLLLLGWEAGRARGVLRRRTQSARPRHLDVIGAAD